MNIHDMTIINVTEVISFLPSRDWFLYLETEQVLEKWQLCTGPAKSTLYILVLKHRLFD